MNDLTREKRRVVMVVYVIRRDWIDSGAEWYSGLAPTGWSDDSDFAHHFDSVEEAAALTQSNYRNHFAHHDVYTVETRLSCH